MIHTIFSNIYRLMKSFLVVVKNGLKAIKTLCHFLFLPAKYFEINLGQFGSISTLDRKFEREIGKIKVVIVIFTKTRKQVHKKINRASFIDD